MMRGLLFLLLITVTQALFVCPPNYCDTLTCPTLQDCNGRVKEHGGWCGCCDACLTQLGEGESCWMTMMFGVPPTSECGEGLHCDVSTKTCQKKKDIQKRQAALPSCTQRLQAVKQAQSSGLPLFGVQEPKCDATGYYAAVQCTGSICYCADKNGNQLSNYQSDIGNMAGMDCQCARDQATYMASGLIGKLFYCDGNGNYRQTTVPPVVTTARPTQTDAPVGNLLNSAVQAGGTAVTGECALKRASLTTQQQSSPLLGVELPNCDADGNYAPRQCAGSECYCVRKDGTKIGDYSSPRWLSEKVTCQCARDKDQFASSGLLGRTYNCRHSGNYQQYQCLGSGCYCTDDTGKMVGSAVPIDKINSLSCA